MVKRLNPDEKVPFLQHLEELRKRIIFCVLFLIAAFAVCYNFSDKLLAPFVKLLGTKMIFLTPLEAMMAYMSLAFYVALFLTVPVLAYQIWAFISPGLLPKEKRLTMIVVPAASGLFLTGLAFCWFVVLPFAIKFLMAYGGDQMIPMISVKAYLSFCLSFLLVFGIIFELPLVIIVIHAMGLVTLEALRNFRRYWIVVAFVIGAILTPTPDVFNQSLTAAPLIVLYEVSLIWIWLFGRKKKTVEND
jgi:sec-independent protein translocase protein TatC